jgi:two-component system, OmpR family, sensor histidine kinase CpxA
MRGLFTKIFLGFWIAQSFTFFISTMLILQHHFIHPGDMMEVLDATLPYTVKAAVDAYQQRGCEGLQQFTASLGLSAYLADSPTHVLCEAKPSPAALKALADSAQQARMRPMQAGDESLWMTSARSSGGQRYLFLISRRRANRGMGWHDLVHFAFPQLPVAIVVFGLTTFVLVLLLVRPIGKLREAARRLANGDLAARVARPDGEERLFGGDEIQGLVHDFNYMAEQLERLVGAQKLLLRDVSHELRSPLARLSVALELATEEAPPPMMEHLQRIERETGRLNLLIGQLLRLSAIESTDASSNMEQFQVSSLLDELLPDAEFEAQQRQCTVRVSSRCDCQVQGNPELIYRAIENIVRNAIRYTRPQSEVELGLHCEELGGEKRVTLEVSDLGPGLPEDELKNVFLPFYRTDDARQRDTGGFGVGLAIADRAVRLHHGEVRARNRPGGGLTVSLTLPCEK